jgi:hypothetical protein
MEEGTSNGTVSDVNGRFSLALRDTGSVIELSYLGYNSLKLPAGKKPADKITMQENLTALDEVVVVGYGTRKKNDVTGSVSTVELSREAKEDEAGQPVMYKPVPPGGNLRSFKKWVNDRLDYSRFSQYPGKQRILVNLTIHTNGRISDIQVMGSVPAPIAGDFKKIISQSPPWKPALRDDTPVEAQVAIRFVISVE